MQFDTRQHDRGSFDGAKRVKMTAPKPNRRPLMEQIIFMICLVLGVASVVLIAITLAMIVAGKIDV